MISEVVRNELIVVLSQPLIVLLESFDFAVSGMILGREFKDSGLGKVVGHYDWLHTAQGQLVGLRTQPFSQPGVEEIVARLGQHPAIDVIGGDFYVFLSSTQEFDESQSTDLEFGVNRILLANDGTFALTYDTALRSEDDMMTLRQWAKDFSGPKS